MIRKILLLFVFLAWTGVMPAGAQDTSHFLQYHSKLTGDAQENEDLNVMETSGEWLMIGASHATADGVPGAGAVYVFRKDASGQWRRHQRIPSPEPGVLARFSPVAIDSDIAVIGNPGLHLEDASFRGRAYVYRFDTMEDQWVLDQPLDPSDADGVNSFGSRIALQNDYLVVSSLTRFSRELDEEPVRLHIFRPDPDTGTWTERQEIVIEGSGNGGQASSLAMDGGLLVVGNHGATVNGIRPVGAVYVYERDDEGVYHRAATIEPPDPQASRHFGVSVALHDGDLLIGDRNGGFIEGTDIGPGFAWLYRAESADNWRLALRLEPVDVVGGQDPLRWNLFFGNAVEITDTMLYVSAPNTIIARDHEARDRTATGLVHAFRRSAGGESAELVQLITAPNPGQSMRSSLGSALHFDGAHLFIGARGARVGDQGSAGAVYVLEPSDMAPVDLAVSAEVIPPVIEAGDEATWVVHIANESETTANEVVLHNRVQNGMAFVSGNPGCVLDDDKIVRCAVGTIASGVIAEVSLTMQVDQGFGTRGTNTHFATALAREPDVNTVNNTVARAVEVLPPEEPEPPPPPRSRGGGGCVMVDTGRPLWQPRDPLLPSLLLLALAGLRYQSQRRTRAE